MKSKIDNTIEFKPKDINTNESGSNSSIKNIDQNTNCKVIPYSKHKKIKHVKQKVNNQVSKLDNFEKHHPLFKKYKPIIIIFVILLVISFISMINRSSLNNTYGFIENLNKHISYSFADMHNNLNTFG